MKRKLKLSPLAIAVLSGWILYAAVMAIGSALITPPRQAALQALRGQLTELQDKLMFARSAKKEETKQRMRDQMTAAQETLSAFSCAASAESALIFQVGQLADTLALDKFSSRFPDSLPELTLEKTERIGEGWLTVEFVADYLKTAAFVNGLERNTPTLFVESIQLRPSDDNAGKADVRMNISYLIRKTPDTTVAVK